MSKHSDYCLSQIGITRYEKLLIVDNSLDKTLTTTTAPMNLKLTQKEAGKPHKAPITLKVVVQDSIKTNTDVSLPSTKKRQAAIDACNSFESLNTLIQSCKQCPLHKNRQQAVVGAGSLKPTWVLIGEAPGAEEDEKGIPFIGQSGKLLTGIFAYFGISREAKAANTMGSAFITNAVKCRPIDNHTPTVDEVSSCQPFLERQIELLEPKILIAVGRIASLALTGDNKTPLGKMRTRIIRFAPKDANSKSNDTPIVVTYHPAYLLRNLPDKKKSWEDVRFAINVLRKSATLSS